RYLKAVVRTPGGAFMSPVGVGTVSNSYALVPHELALRRCLDGISMADAKVEELECELGLTDYGEWINFRVYFPPRFDYNPSDQKRLRLRLECFNAVDGTSSLVVLLGWFRAVCSNGMVIGDTRMDVRQTHNI